jgi:hypothetical protein
LKSYLLLFASGNTPGRDLPTETSSLERFTKNPEQELERIGFINPARGGTILLTFPDSSVVRSEGVFKDKFVSADTDQSPQIHLDLEQTVTEYYSFPSSKVLNGQEKKDDVLTL